MVRTNPRQPPQCPSTRRYNKYLRQERSRWYNQHPRRKTWYMIFQMIPLIIAASTDRHGTELPATVRCRPIITANNPRASPPPLQADEEYLCQEVERVRQRAPPTPNNLPLPLTHPIRMPPPVGTRNP